MNRLLCAGSGDIYQIAHVFRGGERGVRHHPEFTMIEWYRLGFDDTRLTDDVERLVTALLAGHVAMAPSQRVTYARAFAERLGVDPLVADLDSLRAALVAARIDVPASIADDRDALLDLDCPLAVATVVSRRPADLLSCSSGVTGGAGPGARQRFGALRGFWPDRARQRVSRALPANEQARRFAEDRRIRQARGRRHRAPDQRLLAALQAGCPTAGAALGFDRLVMIAAGKQAIDQALAFTAERA